VDSSDDGTRLAFGTAIPQGTQTSTIAIMDMNTHPVSELPGSDGMFSPRWSPDGRYLAALSFEIPAKKLFLYDFHTRKWTPWITDVGGWTTQHGRRIANTWNTRPHPRVAIPKFDE
jgi:tricorn protease-like protein